MHAVYNKAIPTWVEDLAHGLSDVAVVLEVLGQRGVVAGQVSEVVHQVKDAGRVRTSSSQEGRSAGRTHCLLQPDIGEFHQYVLLEEHTACCNETLEIFIRTFCWDSTLLAAAMKHWRTSSGHSAGRTHFFLQ